MENLIIQILLYSPEILFGCGVLFLIKRSFFVKNGQTTLAEVTEIQERQNTKMGTGHVRVIYHPVLKFEDDDGVKYTCIVGQGGRFLSFNVGESVEVIYDKSNPNNSRLHHWFFLWPMPILLTASGAAAIYLKYIH